MVSISLEIIRQCPFQCEPISEGRLFFEYLMVLCMHAYSYHAHVFQMYSWTSVEQN